MRVSKNMAVFITAAAVAVGGVYWHQQEAEKKAPPEKKTQSGARSVVSIPAELSKIFKEKWNKAQAAHMPEHNTRQETSHTLNDKQKAMSQRLDEARESGVLAQAMADEIRGFESEKECGKLYEYAAEHHAYNELLEAIDRVINQGSIQNIKTEILNGLQGNILFQLSLEPLSPLYKESQIALASSDDEYARFVKNVEKKLPDLFDLQILLDRYVEAEQKEGDRESKLTALQRARLEVIHQLTLPLSGQFEKYSPLFDEAAKAQRKAAKLNDQITFELDCMRSEYLREDPADMFGDLFGPYEPACQGPTHP